MPRIASWVNRCRYPNGQISVPKKTTEYEVVGRRGIDPSYPNNKKLTPLNLKTGLEARNH